MNIIKKIANKKDALSRCFDEKLSSNRFLNDANQEVRSTVYDVGCGKNPAISIQIKQKLQAKVIGIDLFANELLQACLGTLNSRFKADIGNYDGHEDGCFLLCQALLEHIPNADSAFESLSCVLRKNCVARNIVPSMNAIFARLNIILPQRLKFFLLHCMFPNTRRDQGFLVFIIAVLSHHLRFLPAQHGCVVEEILTYYKSSYFSFFFTVFDLATMDFSF